MAAVIIYWVHVITQRKAIDRLKSKGGIKLKDPNAVKKSPSKLKRKVEQALSGSSSGEHDSTVSIDLLVC